MDTNSDQLSLPSHHSFTLHDHPVQTNQKHSSSYYQQLKNTIEQQKQRITQLQNQIHMKENIISKYERKFYLLFNSKNKVKDHSLLKQDIQSIFKTELENAFTHTDIQSLQKEIQQLQNMLNVKQDINHNQIMKLKVLNYQYKAELAQKQLELYQQKNQKLKADNKLLKYQIKAMKEVPNKTNKKVKIEKKKQLSNSRDLSFKYLNKDKLTQIDSIIKIKNKQKINDDQQITKTEIDSNQANISFIKHESSKLPDNKQIESQEYFDDQYEQVDEDRIDEQNEQQYQEEMQNDIKEEVQYEEYEQIHEQEQQQVQESTQPDNFSIDNISQLFDQLKNENDDVMKQIIQGIQQSIQDNKMAQINEFFIEKIKQSFKLSQDKSVIVITNLISILVKLNQEPQMQLKLIDYMINKAYSQQIMNILLQFNIKFDFYQKLLQNLGITQNLNYLDNLQIGQTNHVQIVYLIILMYLVRRKQNANQMMQISYKSFETYNKMRSYQNQQNNLDKLFRQFQLNKLFFMFILGDQFFGNNVWKVDDFCQSDLFLFKNSKQPDFKFKINQTYERLPYFPSSENDSSASSNQIVSLVLKYLDFQLIYQFYNQDFKVNQNNQDNHQISLLILYIYWKYLKVEGSVVFQKSKDYLLSIFQANIQDVLVEIQQPRILNDYLNPKKLNFSFYMRNLLDQICYQIEKEQHFIEKNMDFNTLHFNIYDYFNSLFILVQMISPQLIQQLIIEKILLGYLNNPKFNQSINQYLSIISYAVINQFINQIKTNETGFKKLSNYMKNQLVTFILNNQHLNDSVNTKMILAFVILTDQFDQQYLQNKLKLDIQIHQKQLQYMRTHFGDYYVQFYEQVRLQ